jgi:site-specific recombinase XerD
MANLKIYLDIRYVSVKTKEAGLKVTVFHHGRTAYIALGISLKPENWDANNCVVVKHPRRKTLNEEIKTKMAEYQLAFAQIVAKYDIDNLNVNELKDMLEDWKNSDKLRIDDNCVMSVFHRFMEHKTGRTKNLYQCTEKKIRAFLGKEADRLRFEQVNVEWLHRFNDYLAQTAPSANARSIHMRNFRAVFNYAIDNEITSNYPFRRFKIKGEPTRKRNFDVETLRAIFNADVLDPWMEKYRDLFKLTFMLIGINFVDLCNLTDVRNGRIEYIRAKTHKPYSIKMEPEIEEIIGKYRGDNHLLNYMDTYKDYRSFYMNTCTGLKAIRERLVEKNVANIDTLTTYWARHSWATIAASLDIPKETIAAALGHSSHTVTDIYIEFDYRKVDEANRRVLNWVLYGYDGGYAPKNKEMQSEKGSVLRAEKRSDMRSINRSAWCSK